MTEPVTPAPVPARSNDLSVFQQTRRPDGWVGRWLIPNVAVLVLLAMLPFLLLADVPWEAWAIASGAYLLNRAGHSATILFVNGLPQTFAVATAGLAMMVRVWIIAFGLFFVGAKIGGIGWGREDLALPALVTFIALFSVDMVARVLVQLRAQGMAMVAASNTAPSEENV